MLRRLSIVALFMLPALSWSEQEDAQVWLDKMTHAVQSLNYEGTFVFMHGDNVETMQIVHGYDKTGVKERLTSLTGEAREVIRDQDLLRCVWPGSKYVLVGTSKERHGLPTVIPSSFDRLSENYDFQLSGRDRIAGLDCVRISINPKDDYRYGYKLCVAEESGMLLQSEMLNTLQKPIERMMFTSLDISDSIPPERFNPTMQGEDFTWHSVASRDKLINQQPDPSWRVDTPPPGFYLTENSRRLIAMVPKPVQHMIFTDGIAAVSIFIAEKDNDVASLRGQTNQGSINAFARDMDHFQVTVVGEVPERTLQILGMSIKHTK